MCEHLLPPSVLSKATLRGNEYAWPLAAVEEAVTAAAACGLANLGGQAQFRIPEGTCELYWLSLDSGARLSHEPWESYVARSAAEVLVQFTALRELTDFIKEALQWPVLNQLYAQGVDLSQYLCFVLYFDTKPS
jgi:hypothetical protein